MPFKLSYSGLFKKKYKSLIKKDSGLKERLKRKMEQIIENPENHDIKKGNLRGIYGVHINPYVILYRIKGDTVEFLNVDHHDKAYKITIK